MKKIIYLITAVLILCCCSKETKETKETGSIYGTITNYTGEPIRAANVGLYSYDYNMLGNLLTKTLTGDEGQYEFIELKSGKYYINVSANGYITTGDDFEVGAGKNVKLDMRLRSW